MSKTAKGSLEALLSPFVEAVVRPQVEAEIASANIEEAEVEAEEKRIQELPDDEFSQEEKNRAINALRLLYSLAPASFITPEEKAEEIKEAVDRGDVILGSAWDNVMLLSADKIANGVINIRIFNKAVMLPPMDPKMSDAFDRSFRGYLNPQNAYDILRQVKQSLPAGQVLPDEMIERLSENNVIVV